ncbi:MetQ/NlpA family ABC transporter substrate-binding protein [Streptococcus suis]|nr:MetQ/NlpA family ABC transporter substrate-binding protein [Streptococcus suis]HEL9644949.1 MetQ/NlpA family ABC transporter substrate-binding protein [Streptococcus suis]
MKLKKLFSFAAVAALSVATLAACGSSSSNTKSSDTETIKVGIMTRDDYTTELWDKITELAAEEGVTVELTEFTDYSQPNKALAEGDVDVNAFQHIYFLNNWNEENGGDLQVAGYTIYSPIRFYSGVEGEKDKYTSIDDIKEGAEIAVPNDATNESRALFLLESAGLIELDVKDGELATLADITKNPKNITITELDASQTARSLESVDGAVINNNYAKEAGLDTDKALYIEQKGANTEVWYNIIAAQNGWEDSDKAKAIKALIAAYNTDEVAEIVERASGGTDFPIWDEVSTK